MRNNNTGNIVLKSELVEQYATESLSPVRLSFDNIYHSMNTIFVIIMADGWNWAMYENILPFGDNSSPYAILFCFLFIMGSKI